ncbi:MAG: hypothetical protein IPM89_12065 [Candidatus Competibacteraceae bacterium]|nr:MAG: hypothetical protein IPM89_12065 [Candidatus Competibacteraceae bacterium]
MMWQDGLALLIVVIAALVVLRIFVPAGILRFGARRGGGPATNTTPAAGGCSGCSVGSSCAKVRINPPL